MTLTKDPAILDTLGFVHLQRGELDTAEKTFQQALAFAGADPVAQEIRQRLEHVQKARARALADP